MCIAQLMVILDATIVNVALPEAQRSLGFAAADRAWVVTAYALAFGSLLLVGGRIADRIGQRTAILIGLAGFGLASALGGAAVGLPMLIAARALQGVFGALLAPATLAVITTTFTSDRDRGKAFGIFGSVAAGGGALGLLLGGVLTEYASWRGTLYVNTAIAAVGLLAAVATLKENKRAPRQPIDLAGTATVTLGLLGLVYGFSNAYEHGWSDAQTLMGLVGGTLLLTLFLGVEARSAHPILPLRILTSRVRGASLLVLFTGSVALFGESLLLTYYLQESLGFSPVEAGLAFLPQALGAVAASLASGVLLRRLPGSVLVPTGILVTAAGLFLLGRIETVGGYTAVVLPAAVLIGAGLGLAISVAVNLGVQGVDPDDAGVASATVNAVQQVGGSIGPSVFNTIAGSVLASVLATGNARLGDAATEVEQQVLAAAAVQSYSVSFDIGAALLLITAIVSALMFGRQTSPGATTATKADPTDTTDATAPTHPGTPSATPPEALDEGARR